MAEACARFGLYVHWPFCESKCPYCDFNSHVRDDVDHDGWRAALIAELSHFAARTPGRTLGSVFFGGGTPSRMAPDTAAAVIEAARNAWPAAADLEITLEANPTSVETARLAAFRVAGVNRVSLGVQSLDDDALQFLGRPHSAREALDAVATAAQLFPRFSFDLIYARPGQDVPSWRAELGRALKHAGDHLSVYQLTLEKGTPFYAAHRRGAFELPDEDTGAALFETTQELLREAGLPAYEISNHAAPGAECRHNLAYWESGEYVGIGPGAHGRLADGAGCVASEQIRMPEAWLSAVQAAGHGTRAIRPVDRAARVEEMLMMGLRLRRGIARGTFLRVACDAPEACLDADRLARLVDGGFLVLDDTGLRATDAGLQRLNAVLAALLG